MKHFLWSAMLMVCVETEAWAGRVHPSESAVANDAGQTANPVWSRTNLAVLRHWAGSAPKVGLPPLSTAALDIAQTRGDAAEIEQAATTLALRLAQLHLLGDGVSRARAGWNIFDTDRNVPLEPLLAQALANESLDSFYENLRPAHPEYAALEAALAREADPSRRRTIALNMERWRWMPRTLGPDHVFVNTARFEAELWRAGRKIGTWRIIAGKKTTPTPVFDTRITGVVLNPWWEIPASIVRESIGALVRRDPAAARARGYVWSGGRYRQKPGPNNALGQMKLVMPNPYSVYMHDTPNKQLFAEKVRAFSHGCVRTDDAIGYAATLLDGVMTSARVDEIVRSGVTTTINLERPLPVYIAYFTASANATGEVELWPDIYARDAGIAVAGRAPVDNETECAAG